MYKFYLTLDISKECQMFMRRRLPKIDKRDLELIIVAMHELVYPGTHTVSKIYLDIAEEMFGSDAFQYIAMIGPVLKIERVDDSGVIVICLP